MEHGHLVTLVVPLALLFLGTLGKKIVRKNGWEWEDAFLGSEAAVAGLTGGLTYILDVLKVVRDRYDAHAPPELMSRTFSNLTVTGLFVVFAIISYLFVLSVHQDWQGKTTANPAPPWWQFWRRRGAMLGIVGNLIGFSILVCFLLIIKTEA